MEKDPGSAYGAAALTRSFVSMVYIIAGAASAKLRQASDSGNLGECMRHDILADTMTILKNAEHAGKQTSVVPHSKLVKSVLSLMQKEGYIGVFEFIDDGKSGMFRVELVGKINKSGAIKPRFAVKKDEYEKWETRYLPAKQFGTLIVSTPRGLITHREAIQQRLGGRLVAYVY